MAIDAVVTGVEGPVLVPGDTRLARKRRVLHPRIGLDPIETFSVLAPEALRIGQRLAVKPEIFGLTDLADRRMSRNRDQGAAGHGALLLGWRRFAPRMAALGCPPAEDYAPALRRYNSRCRPRQAAAGAGPEQRCLGRSATQVFVTLSRSDRKTSAGR